MRIVDPNTNRDVLTGEEVPPSAVVTPTTVTPPEITAIDAVSLPLVAVDEVEAPSALVTPAVLDVEEAPTSPIVDISAAPSENAIVAVVEEISVEKKTVPTVAASSSASTSATPTVPATVTAPIAPVQPAPVIEKEVIPVPVAPENGEVPSVSEPPSSTASPTPVLTAPSPEQVEGKAFLVHNFHFKILCKVR